ncbi:acetyltransferase [Allobranchiibius sp. GilTou38]|uniref:acetyltransferase n=1 Tax=Allobranchiibius sp. GilTou38 TaxID=2815210 RepID=UPI001AA0D736|nr:acetyltransferase [Allobranchiibius sp. GilTou38]MBO1767487.1 acetyltransferase [Allobranchiibius sp. GilTou38]
MIRDLVVVGCGGFGREVLEIVAAINHDRADWRIVGVLDDAPCDADLRLLKERDVDHLGGVGVLAELPPTTYAVLGIGSPAARRVISSRHPGRRWATLVHPAATLGSDVTVAPGAVIAPGSRLSTHISVGAHVQIDQNVTVGHDSRLGDFCRLNPQACISGSVDIGAGAYVGANATVLQGLHVGEGSIVGAGAVVVRDVDSARTVKGVPAR